MPPALPACVLVHLPPDPDRQPTLRAARALAFAVRPADTGRVSWVVELIFAFALPHGAGFALISAWRGTGWLREPAAVRAAPPEPIERLQADLRRLRAELEDTETGPA